MDSLAKLSQWMMSVGRLSDDPVKVVSHFCASLVEAGVPLWRANIAQRFANPLLVGWGIVWKPEGTNTYEVTHERLRTDAYVGSAFEYVLENKCPLQKSLRHLDLDEDHISYLEFAELGGTDYYATLLQYGDGSIHGCSFVTQATDGFLQRDLELIEATLPMLSSALEPITMRKSSRSLLRTYLGNGPSEAVWKGSIQRGKRKTLDAVVMFSDLRGFTALSDSASEDEVLDALNDYFDVVVQSVEEMGGDVLKFMGDGILSVFTIAKHADHNHQCRQAAHAARRALAGIVALNDRRTASKKPPLDIGIGINVGQVSYGNIGSPGRLDFTVLGSTVNVASRIEGLTKSTGHKVLVTNAVAEVSPVLFAQCGSHKVRGITDPIELFHLIEE